MSNFTNLFPGGGAVLAPSFQTNFIASRTWTAPQDGVVVVRAMGAGGGGARHTSNATGGYSGAWGAKAVRVKKGDTVVVTIGAAGAGKSTTDGDGTAGGDTTVVIGGVTYTAPGGPGGKAGAASALPNGPSPSTNWDFGADSVKPGWAAGNIRTGGAGVDILAQGNNATTSNATDGSGGGGTGSPSTGGQGGGANGRATANGQIPTASGTPIYGDASNGEWGLSFYGGSGSASAEGANGGGGAGGTSSTDSVGKIGGNGGGGGGAIGSYVGGNGGIGGGGGATQSGTKAGDGGPGFTHLKFYADMGL